MIDRQKRCEEESARLIVSLSDKFKYRGASPYELLTLFSGLTPWLTSSTIHVDGCGYLAQEDPTWERDQHIILVKTQNEFGKEELKTVVHELARHMQHDEVLQLLNVMIKYLQNLHDQADLLEMLQKDVKRIEENDDDLEAAEEGIELWMSDQIIGPICCTRSLDNEYYPEPVDYPNDHLTVSMRKEINKFYNYKVSGITMISNDVFIFDGNDIEEMDWPIDILFDYVGISEDRYVEKKVESSFVKSYYSDYIEFGDHDDTNKYEFVVEKVTGINRVILSMKYGTQVFANVDCIMMRIFQSEVFLDWVKSVQWTLWFGRDEQEKLNDIEALTQKLKELEQENEELRQN